MRLFNSYHSVIFSLIEWQWQYARPEQLTANRFVGLVTMGLEVQQLAWVETLIQSYQAILVGEHVSWVVGLQRVRLIFAKGQFEQAAGFFNTCAPNWWANTSFSNSSSADCG